MTNSNDKTIKSSTITAAVTKYPKTTQASKPSTPQLSSVKGISSPLHTKASDDAWQKRIGAAHKVWSKLSESELKKSAGEPAKLAELVQMRYSISRPDADKQVKNFIDNRS
ncbi:hypothetical protein [Rheinheimera sp. MM224]|uniref:hypothetical protein n=1 Tax=Rheinheimera sp. MM224 TaxID=3019969 RepID=UPI0021F89CEC|nr:hypothetical protein [Rheinheimera sp. MM224]CAI3797835.1 hypothetical protein JAMGFMIE_01919 [Rheinheimera sp. MM224]